MNDRRRGARLAQEALAALRARHDVAGQHLERDVAAELLVARAVDDAHAAATELLVDPEVRDPIAHGEDLRGRALGLEGGEQGVHVPEPVGGGEREAAAKRALEGGRRRGRVGRDHAGFDGQPHVVERRAARDREGPPVEDRLPQRDAEAELIGARVGDLAAQLLG